MLETGLSVKLVTLKALAGIVVSSSLIPLGPTAVHMTLTKGTKK